MRRVALIGAGFIARARRDCAHVLVPPPLPRDVALPLLAEALPRKFHLQSVDLPRSAGI